MRNSNQERHSALFEGFGCIAAAMLAVLALSSLGCDQLTKPPDADATVFAREGTTEDTQQGSDVHAIVDDTEASATVGDRAATTSVVSNGPDTEASASGTVHTCFQASQNASLSLFVFFDQSKFEWFCPAAKAPASSALPEGRAAVPDAGYAGVYMTVSRNGLPPTDLYTATATLGCDDTDVANQGFPTCTSTFPGRTFCTGQTSALDTYTVIAGDKLEVDFTVGSYSALTPAVVSNATFQVLLSAQYQLNGTGFSQTDCPGKAPCDTNGDCTGGDLCLGGNCGTARFGPDFGVQVVTVPDPLNPGQAFDVTVSADLHAGDLLPYELKLDVPQVALDLNGTAPAGTIVGTCTVPGITVPVVATDQPDVFYADADFNGSQDFTDPLVTVGYTGGQLEVDVHFPWLFGVTTVPADATLTCQLSQLFVAGDAGSYTATADAASIDLDTNGADDGSGFTPLQYHQVFDIQVGPVANCADPVGFVARETADIPVTSTITASDALVVLRTAVGLATCELCVCDVDGSGTISATDALITLKAAVGQPVTLACPACS